MDTVALVFAYAAAALVAIVVTAAFSPAMSLILSKLIPPEILPAWSQFVRFALFVASFAGGIPEPNPGRFIDRNAPSIVPPVEGEGLMMVMRSLGGALMAASWTLLMFFSVTLAAYMAGRVWVLIKQRRGHDAKEIEEREEKAKQDASEGRRPEPHKRQKPAEARPVRKEPEKIHEPKGS